MRQDMSIYEGEKVFEIDSEEACGLSCTGRRAYRLRFELRWMARLRVKENVTKESEASSRQPTSIVFYFFLLHSRTSDQALSVIEV